MLQFMTMHYLHAYPSIVKEGMLTVSPRDSPRSMDTLSETAIAEILRGWVHIMLQNAPLPVSISDSNRYWGSCVVLPHPVSPDITTTYHCNQLGIKHIILSKWRNFKLFCILQEKKITITSLWIKVIKLYTRLDDQIPFLIKSNFGISNNSTFIGIVGSNENTNSHLRSMLWDSIQKEHLTLDFMRWSEWFKKKNKSKVWRYSVSS